jgi:Protein of unknown function (DUF1566)
MFSRRWIQLTFIFSSGLLLSACGGAPGLNTAPLATNVTISVENAQYVLVGDVLTGTYSYSDAENDAEGASFFRWLRDGLAISGATAATYVTVLADADTKITFEVTPLALRGDKRGDSKNSAASTVRKPFLNDTGITLCADYAYTDTDDNAPTASGTHNNLLDCAIQATVPTVSTDGFEVAATGGDILRAGQDALYGRDLSDGSNADGIAGFSYTKIDMNGAALSNQGQTYANAPWPCVKDNVTALVWEVKTTTGLQATNNTYTWYNSNLLNHGGDLGVASGGVCTGSDCDTEKYIAAINSAGLCAATDWRLPTKHELASLVNAAQLAPALDENYFPNTLSGYYWSASAHANNQFFAWYVDFNDGSVYRLNKGNRFSVRLVRDVN